MEKAPERIGRYRILRVLGKGAMGVVYLAHDPQIDREIALKTIRFSEAEGSFNPEEAKARFLKEARISGRLHQHPNIVTVFDVGEDGGTLFLAMEYVPGGSFSQRLADPDSLRSTSGSGSPRRWPMRSPTRTTGESSTATSSRPTSS